MRGSGAAITGIGILLASCSSVAPARPNFLPQMQVMQANQNVAAFLAQEAVGAGITEVFLTDNAGMARLFGSDAIGLTRFQASGRQIDVYFNLQRPGGAAAENIAHEIAHAAAYRRGCENHGAVWRDESTKIARRVEARFPGMTWSGLRPTEYAMAEAATYPDERC